MTTPARAASSLPVGRAHLRALRRTAIGPFDVGRARPVADAELLPPAAAVAFLDRVTVGGEVAELVRRGRRLQCRGQEVTFGGAGPWAVVDEGTGGLLAVYRAGGELAVPDVVLA